MCEFSALQELVSHSMDRPERQQLKEALEAMQVEAELIPTCVHVILHTQPSALSLTVGAGGTFSYAPTARRAI